MTTIVVGVEVSPGLTAPISNPVNTKTERYDPRKERESMEMRGGHTYKDDSEPRFGNPMNPIQPAASDRKPQFHSQNHRPCASVENSVWRIDLVCKDVAPW